MWCYKKYNDQFALCDIDTQRPQVSSLIDEPYNGGTK